MKQEISMFDIEPAVFCQKVENEAKDCQSYIDAVLIVCEEFEIDPTASAKLLSVPIIEKIQIEGTEFNLLPKKSELPV
tara:strand:+ start:463 stop:696 length:234 start_codon:yes stop_codon:yes gene_type:complete